MSDPHTIDATATDAAYTGPIIDVHLHAFDVATPGPGRPGSPRAAVSPAFAADLRYDGSKPWSEVLQDRLSHPLSRSPIWAAGSTTSLRDQTLAAMEALNIRGVVSGPPNLVRQYETRAPGRVIPALEFDRHRFAYSPADVDALLRDGFTVFGEVTDQYNGTAMDDPVLDPFWEIAANHDVPVGIHTGIGPPGAPAVHPGFRAALHSPFGLERLLTSHPTLRVWAMHAAWPMVDELKAMLYTYPQLHVDTGFLHIAIPRTEYYRFLGTLVDAGFIDRIMYGTDQIIWPGLIELGVSAINEAPFLTHDQKRAILHDNAARFLRLEH